MRGRHRTWTARRGHRGGSPSHSALASGSAPTRVTDWAATNKIPHDKQTQSGIGEKACEDCNGPPPEPLSSCAPAGTSLGRLQRSPRPEVLL